MIDTELINSYIKAGLPIFPCKEDKSPATVNGVTIDWVHYEAEVNKDIQHYRMVGLKCGVGDDPFFLIDFDLKNTSDKDMFTKYIKDVQLQNNIVDDPDIRKNIDKSLLIENTINGGYHIWIRVNNADGNLHLAYSEDKKIIIETKGFGGYGVISPSSGYNILSKNIKSFLDVPVFNTKERYFLQNIAYGYDKENSSPYVVRIKTDSYTTKDGSLTPWVDFDNKVDGVELLMQYGWKISKESGDRTYLTRPGKEHGISGNWHIGLRLLKIYSSNVSEFPDINKAYTSFAIYTMYEHNGDFTSSAKALYSKGYGDRLKDESSIEFDNLSEHTFDFKEQRTLLEKYYRGEIEQGKTTGSVLLDRYFLFKKNEFVQIIADTNIGKTYVMKYIIALAIRFAGWKILIAAQENRPWDFLDDTLSFITGKSGLKSYKRGDIDYDKQMDFLSTRIKFIKCSHKSIFNVLDIAKELNEKEGYDMLFLDPLNGFKIDTKLGLGSGNEYHQQCAMELLNFANDEMSVFLNTHTIVSSQRGRKIENRDGSLSSDRRIPRPTDAEYGSAYANKADTVIVMDRALDAENETDRNTTSLWVKKVRTKKLGGNISPDANPVLLEYISNPFGFNIYCAGESEYNPLRPDNFKNEVQEVRYQEIQGEVPF